MSARVIKEGSYVKVSEMQIGQYGILREGNSGYNGQIVQKWDNRLHTVGRTMGHSWPNLEEIDDMFRIEILPLGTVIEVVIP